MKPWTRILTAARAFAAIITLTVGSAASHPNKQALVCPQCKVVMVEHVAKKSHSPDEAVSHWEENERKLEHSCPGCQGALNRVVQRRQAPPPALHLRKGVVSMSAQPPLTLTAQTKSGPSSRTSEPIPNQSPH